MSKKKDTVLFVDDEEINLFLFEKTFEKDFNVKTASSGVEALESLGEHGEEIKVVISDMRMPVMNGLEFVEKARNKSSGIFFFILTGYEINRELRSALEANLIDQLFHKPFDYHLIKKAITDSIPK